MKIPKIGIVAWRSNEHMGISIPYANYFSKFGIVTALMPSNDFIPELDLVVLPGGPDLSSAEMNIVPSYANSTICPFREYFYRVTLDKYIKAGIPVFGICLGLQQLNAKYGGKMVMDFPFEYSEPRNKEVDELTFTKEGEEFKRIHNISMKKLKVNSLHHQGVMDYQLSEEFNALAFTTNYGQYTNIEVIKHKTLPIAVVQYHPEELTGEPIAKNLILDLIKHKR